MHVKVRNSYLQMLWGKHACRCWELGKTVTRLDINIISVVTLLWLTPITDTRVLRAYGDYFELL